VIRQRIESLLHIRVLGWLTNGVALAISNRYCVCLFLSPIPGDNSVHIAAHYAKTNHSINRLSDLLHF